MLTAACVLSALAVSADAMTLEAGRLSVSVASDNFSYVVSVDGKPWFDSSGDSLGFAFSADGKTFSVSEGTMEGSARSPASGSDPAGEYNEVAIEWRRSNAALDADAEWVSVFRAYASRDAIVFRQEWPSGLANTAGSTFPSLRAVDGSASFGTLEYTGSSCGFMVSAKGDFPGISGGTSKGYVVIAPRNPSDSTSSNTSAPALAIGPVTEHFTNTARNGGDSLCYGMESSFTFTPPGYSIETVLTAAAAREGQAERASVPPSGINSALLKFGDFLLARHGKQRARGDHNTLTRYIGYSTTAFYFYNLCDCNGPAPKQGGKPNIHIRERCVTDGGSSPIPTEFLSKSAKPGVCDSYEDTLLAVDAGLRAQGIPYKHMLLDSWWYGEVINGGAALWEDVPECVGNASFPRSLQFFQSAIGKPLWAHNGIWTQGSPYRDQYEFAGPKGAPQGQPLWDHLFGSNSKKWNLTTIKQDHMAEQIGATPSGFTNVSVFKSWLTGMGDAASKYGVGVLYCCAPPSVHMNGVTVPSAYAVRASPDYVWAASGRTLKLPTVQWALGPDNAFHWLGLGLLPYKDTFFSNSTMGQTAGLWSKDTNEWAQFLGYREQDAQTHALMALLSMGHVTFGDAVFASNKTLLMQLIRSDGVLLKTDRPATAIDAQFHAMMFGEWPNGGGGGACGGPGSICAAPCDASDERQLWRYDSTSGGLGLAAGKGAGCVDIKHCSKDAGERVDLFQMPDGGDCASPPTTPWGTCDAKNERWSLEPGNKTAAGTGDGSFALLVSQWSGKCLRVDDKGATVEECDASDGRQQFFASKPDDQGRVTIGVSGTTACLTGTAPTWNGFDSRDELNAAVEASEGAFPRGYESAYATSAEWMRRAEIRSARNINGEEEQCSARFGAPQGPLGEVYSTHTTVSGSTWRYIVGVQLSGPFAVQPADLAIPAGDRVVAVRWDDAKTFRPDTTDELQPLNDTFPLTLVQSDGEECQTGVSPIDVKTKCFPVQWYVIAPVFDNGWVFIGETGKLVPVSGERISSVAPLQSGGFQVKIKGEPGEVVTMGAASTALASSQVRYAQATIGADGTADITLSDATPVLDY